MIEAGATVKTSSSAERLVPDLRRGRGARQADAEYPRPD
jgi:hypothetical protein